MGLALPDEFEFIVSDQTYQGLCHRSKQACGTAVPWVNSDSERTQFIVPFQHPCRPACFKHLIDYGEIDWTAVHRSVYHSPRTLAKLAGMSEQPTRCLLFRVLGQQTCHRQPVHHAFIIGEGVMALVTYTVLAVYEVKGKVVGQEEGA